MKYLTTFLFITLLAIGCAGESDTEQQSAEFSGEGVEVEGAWARPASEGRMSAAYFLISNFNDSDDQLIGVESDVAQLVEIHESYEREEGMMGMREVPEVDLPSQSTVRFQQGGLHIMLIQVTRTLADGDTFELTLHFDNSESQTIEVPVRL
ncbi:copper chaperone PCu(A)C [Rhodohalobacter halophilus]|uniref:copper chaperone PCu(A)C n=1 Tax=Rhodohalobacter halophilus TaxID=1812810 RepID=UPI0009FDBAB3|nr:copper chaperone PCu(A)C [Rhodohalobacter halophilus]